MTTSSTRARRSRDGGPPLLVPGLSLAVLTVLGGVLGGSGPRPDSSAADVLAYVTANATLVSVAAALLFGSAFPLIVYAATVRRRLQLLGIPAPGPVMGFGGAVVAAGALMASALVSWASAQTATLGDAAIARLLATLWFAAGGVGFVAPFGLLLAGIAVPALIGRLLPAWLAWAGLVVAVLAVLSTFALITPVLYVLLPVGRFGGLLFLLAVAVLLPARRTTGKVAA